MERYSLCVLLMAIAMSGCGGKPPVSDSSAAGDRASFYLQYTIVLNNDAAATSRCTMEERTVGNDRGPICHKACDTADILIKFERSNQSLMQRSRFKGDAPSEQHPWCGNTGNAVTHGDHSAAVTGSGNTITIK